MIDRVPAIIVHGGAGTYPPDGIEEIRAGMAAAVHAGWTILSRAGSALDAVDAAVRVLEDHPGFNAGHGAVLTADGTVQLDASIMEGTTLRCGAVAAVTGIANPISLARRILDDGRHVLLAGTGALRFAASVGIPQCDPQALITEHQRARWAARRARPSGPPTLAAAPGTVGAVALDRAGTVAAATSTGGVAGQLPGRVGDSALIGCGTCADSTIGGVSCTGSGESIIRVVLARRALDFLKEAGEPDYAARVAVDLLVDEGRGQGGLILLDWRGRTGFATSTPFMPVAWRSAALAGAALSV